jgi:hypothetical protein
LALFLTLGSVSFADSLVGNFNLDTSLDPIPSQGQVTFTLNGDGTISASLVTYNYAILGFGFDSVESNIAESGFSPTTPDYPNVGWFDAFGSQNSGFYCSTCGFAESWTIGSAGEFTSVWQALGGGNASVDFFLYDSNQGQYGGNAGGQSGVPEPGSLVLLGAGLAGLALVRRRNA